MKKKKSIRTVLKSLRFRFFLAIFLMGLIPCTILSVGLYYIYEQEELQSNLISILSQSQIINNQIITTGYLSNADNDTVNTQIDTMAQAFMGRVMILDSSMRVVKDTYELYTDKTIISQFAMEAATGGTSWDYNVSDGFLVVGVPIYENSDAIDIFSDEDVSSDKVVGVLLFTRSTDMLFVSLTFLFAFIVILLLVDAIISYIIAIVLSKHFTKPLNKMANSISDIQKGIGVGSLEINNYTETKEISECFNEYSSQMKMIDESRQEFVSNVSHELKTPLTSMKVLADSINSMGEAPVELYQEFMGDIANEIDRETNIINDLLSLVKLDKSKAQLNIVPINMNELIEAIMKRLKPIAEKQEVELVLESFRPITVEMDETKFSLAMTNLIENGIKYNKTGGWVHVSINADHQYCFIHVEDSGMGIPEEALDHIFERFYRADKSHSREIGGYGRGLAITQKAILMHHGEIKVMSTLGEGTQFFVRVPLNFIAKED